LFSRPVPSLFGGYGGDMVKGCCENLIGIHIGCINDPGIGYSPQWGYISFPVPLVTHTHILQNVAEHSRLACAKQLLDSAVCANLEIGVNEQLDRGIRQDHRSDVTAVQNRTFAMWWSCGEIAL
jgi:hypothetical protein